MSISVLALGIAALFQGLASLFFPAILPGVNVVWLIAGIIVIFEYIVGKRSTV